VKRSFVAAVSAALLTVSLSVPAFAQVQLAEEVITKLTELGFDMTDVVVTEEQVLQLEGVLNGTDPADVQKAEIEKILAAE
jgi:hypothetical protein